MLIGYHPAAGLVLVLGPARTSGWVLVGCCTLSRWQLCARVAAGEVCWPFPPETCHCFSQLIRGAWPLIACSGLCSRVRYLRLCALEVATGHVSCRWWQQAGAQ